MFFDSLIVQINLCLNKLLSYNSGLDAELMFRCGDIVHNQGRIYTTLYGTNPPNAKINLLQWESVAEIDYNEYRNYDLNVEEKKSLKTNINFICALNYLDNFYSKEEDVEEDEDTTTTNDIEMLDLTQTKWILYRSNFRFLESARNEFAYMQELFSGPNWNCEKILGFTNLAINLTNKIVVFFDYPHTKKPYALYRTADIVPPIMTMFILVPKETAKTIIDLDLLIPRQILLSIGMLTPNGHRVLPFNMVEINDSLWLTHQHINTTSNYLLEHINRLRKKYQHIIVFNDKHNISNNSLEKLKDCFLRLKLSIDQVYRYSIIGKNILQLNGDRKQYLNNILNGGGGSSSVVNGGGKLYDLDKFSSFYGETVVIFRIGQDFTTYKLTNSNFLELDNLTHNKYIYPFISSNVLAQHKQQQQQTQTTTQPVVQHSILMAKFKNSTHDNCHMYFCESHQTLWFSHKYHLFINEGVRKLDRFALFDIIKQYDIQSKPALSQCLYYVSNCTKKNLPSQALVHTEFYAIGQIEIEKGLYVYGLWQTNNINNNNNNVVNTNNENDGLDFINNTTVNYLATPQATNLQKNVEQKYKSFSYFIQIVPAVFVGVAAQPTTTTTTIHQHAEKKVALVEPIIMYLQEILPSGISSKEISSSSASD